MTLLIPLGLLGLLSIIILIIIYIIKPNYQQKEVTSTFVWKLSLKYRKKRLPTSKLRNILLILCQVFTLVAGAFILAQPIIRHENAKYTKEAVIIIDASASMRASSNGETRFERAVESAIDYSNEIFSKGGEVSVIISDNTPHFIANRVGIVGRDDLFADLRDMVDNIDTACSYGVTDLNKAITLCEDTVQRNPTTSIYLCTDTEYGYVPEGVTLNNVAKNNEYNIAILDAYTIFEEGYYTFVVKVGCYGETAETVPIDISINGAKTAKSEGFSKEVVYGGVYSFGDNTENTIIFRNSKIAASDYEKNSENVFIEPVGDDVIGSKNLDCVYEYTDAHIYLDINDSFSRDNSFSIYGGVKNELKVQYVTDKKKTFITAAIDVFRNRNKDRWNLKFTEVLLPKETPASEGYDFYIFENYKPEVIPTDGVVFLMNPPEMPTGLGMSEVKTYTNEMYILQEDYHDILKYVNTNKIYVTQCTELSTYDDTIYKVLWSVDSHPLLLIQDDENTKLIISLFNIEYSNLGIRTDMFYFFDNIFDYFMPSTVVGNAFEVGEEIMVNARSKTLTVTRNSDDREQVITQLPSSIVLDKPDTYKFSQVNYFGNKLPDEYIFVKIPSVESNIFAEGKDMKEIYREKIDEDIFDDLLVYIAAIMLFLMFAEWFLQAHDNG